MKEDANQSAVMGSADRYEMSQKANELRKNGEYKKALALYLELSKDSSDKFVAAGSLYCLRKLGRFDEALRLCSEPPEAHLNFDWYRNEVIQVLIEGKLKRIDDSVSFDELVKTAESVLRLHPRDHWKIWYVVR